MANNIHISYDLHNPGKNYDALIDAIKKISGKWAKIHYSFWYVKTPLTSAQVRDALVPHLDKNDSLYVVDAKNNMAS
ncbi:hypothetical protein [Falsiroseomonas oryziterrae]|uniref:hypothetical protein n=1 Tax=Falsiroseomonas oryziterrae TaxID=2911368 RepID=UPI001F216AD3|nr:hypothetical protein [Roseomonas sp. NPKOSM-4]